MTLIHASGIRKSRSAIPQSASSRAPVRLFLEARWTANESLPDAATTPIPFQPQIWMSARTRQRACALQDAPGLPADYRLALLFLTQLYRVSLLSQGEGAD